MNTLILALIYINIYNVTINSSSNIIYRLLHYIYIYNLHENLYDFKMAIKAITIKLSFIAKRCKKVQPMQSIGSRRRRWGEKWRLMNFLKNI